MKGVLKSVNNENENHACNIKLMISDLCSVLIEKKNS